MIRRILTAVLAATLLLSSAPAFAAADKPLVIESGQIKQLPSATTLQTQAPTTGAASINLPHGTAPTTPTNGDCWTTTTGLYCQINGATVGPYGTGGGGGGSGSLVLLEAHTASSSAALNFTTSISSTYDAYLVELVDVTAATNGANLTMQMSTDGGSTYSATGYQYAGNLSNAAGGSPFNNASTSATAIVISHAVSNVSGWGISGEVRIYNPGSTTMRKQVMSNTVGEKNDGNWYLDFRGGLWSNTSAYNAFRFIMSSGNITSGTIRVYGITH